MLRDDDITALVSPNLQLVNDLLMHRLAPAFQILGNYMHSNYPLLSKPGSFLLRRKIDELNYKYFSGHHGEAVFEKYKTYRLMVLQCLP